MADMAETIRAYILEEFLPGVSSEELEDTTPLISGGIIDSIGTLMFVGYLEERFGIEIQAHEINDVNFENVAGIVRFVNSKLE
jgi:acyl carrier protein